MKILFIHTTNIFSGSGKGILVNVEKDIDEKYLKKHEVSYPHLGGQWKETLEKLQIDYNIIDRRNSDKYNKDQYDLKYNLKNPISKPKNIL